MASGIGSGISGVLGGIGGAVSDFFGAEGSEAGAEGDFQAAKYYADAGDIALQNKTISESSTLIQEAQLNRKIFQATGTAEATAGAAGGTEGGSAGDILRNSSTQGALAKALVSQQGAINANSYQAQYEGLKAQEASMIGAGNAELKAAEAKNAGGFMNLLGAGVSLIGMFL